MTAVSELELAGWRRSVAELYAAVRAEGDAERGHERWRAGRDRLFRTHPQSPLLADDPLRHSGVPYWGYERTLRFTLPLLAPAAPRTLSLPTDRSGDTKMRLVGHLELPAPVGATIDVWWLEQYAGGLFLPLRDRTAGSTSYGGGRYLLDTAKGADLGGTSGKLIVDLNFLYHPSCRYNPAWQCPLAPAGNVVDVPIAAGERL
jgi:uncharacterized protein (DUF1684 family)